MPKLTRCGQHTAGFPYVNALPKISHGKIWESAALGVPWRGGVTN